MAFELPPLPFARNELMPHISEETLNFHYGKHHAAYVNKLNALVKGTEWEKKSLHDIIAKADGAIFNNAAQIYNHTFYWKSMGPRMGGEPRGEIKKQIDKDYGNFEQFKTEFSAAASGHFGSGWAWLMYKDGRLNIHQTHDAGNPLRDGSGSPIITCDVWEHAYYIDFRNDRPAYLKDLLFECVRVDAAWWNLVNWDFANENLKKARELKAS